MLLIRGLMLRLDRGFASSFLLSTIERSKCQTVYITQTLSCLDIVKNYLTILRDY